MVSMGDLDIGATGSYYSFSFMVFSWVTWIKLDPVKYQNLDAFGSYHPKAEHSWTASLLIWFETLRMDLGVEVESLLGLDVCTLWQFDVISYLSNASKESVLAAIPFLMEYVKGD